MVFLVTDVYESQRVCGDSPRVVELAVARALAAECPEEPPLRIEHLQKGDKVGIVDGIRLTKYSEHGMAIIVFFKFATQATVWIGR